MSQKNFKVALVPNLNTRLQQYQADLGSVDGVSRTVESATYRDYVELLKGLADGDVPETDYPLNRMMEQCQRTWSAAKEGRIRDQPIENDAFRSLPVGKTKTLPFRVSVPDSKRKEPVPLVIALHGAGGTENLFFEGYGNGHAIKECLKRGWFLVAPRSGINFNGGPPVKELVETLVKRFPIDPKRIFVVGHSMGAAQTIAVCQEYPTLFAAAAALGGGGRVKDAKPFENLPVFIGIGAKDFGRAGAKSLHRSLVDGGAKHVTFREYPEIEHLVIVREALPDAFAMFDTASKTVQQSK